MSLKPTTVSAPIVTVDEHGLSVAASATLDYAVHCLDAAPARELTEAWEDPETLFAAPTDRLLAEDDFDAIDPWPPDRPLAVDRNSPVDFTEDLTALGFTAQTEPIWDDTASLTFLDEPRRLHLLTIETPFWLCTALEEGEPDAATVAVYYRHHIRPGHYLFAETIGAAGTRITLHGIWTCPQAATTEGLADIDGFDAWQIDAMCDACQRRWISCGGSGWCNPDPDDVGNDLEWHFEDATGHRDNTVECPIGWCPGRVSFTV